MVAIKTNIAHRSNYGSKRNTSTIKYIVIHYTANDGDTDEANANYFKGANRRASAHYFVDDNSITRSVYDNYIAWSVGGSKYSNCSKTGGGKLYRICTNTNSISIEMCDTKKDGKYAASQKTLENTYDLVVKLMKQYDIDIDHVIRHFDVTGKSCPAYLVNDTKWKQFKEEVMEVYNGKKYSGEFPDLPARGYFKVGDKGEEVKKLQKFLNWYGDYKLTVDGDLGPKSQTAIKAFQTKEGLTADGLFGKSSLKRAKEIRK